MFHFIWSQFSLFTKPEVFIVVVFACLNYCVHCDRAMETCISHWAFPILLNYRKHFLCFFFCLILGDFQQNLEERRVKGNFNKFLEFCIILHSKVVGKFSYKVEGTSIYCGKNPFSFVKFCSAQLIKFSTQIRL